MFCSKYQRGLDPIWNPMGRYEIIKNKEDVGAQSSINWSTTLGASSQLNHT